VIHVPLPAVVIPEGCGTCHYGGPVGPHGGAHARCTCGARSAHDRLHDRLRWHLGHRRQVRAWRRAGDVRLLAEDPEITTW
jgi:hypothetical protein